MPHAFFIICVFHMFEQPPEHVRMDTEHTLKIFCRFSLHVDAQKCKPAKNLSEERITRFLIVIRDELFFAGFNIILRMTCLENPKSFQYVCTLWTCSGGCRPNERDTNLSVRLYHKKILKIYKMNTKSILESIGKCFIFYIG